jgi:hypothetical protein
MSDYLTPNVATIKGSNLITLPIKGGNGKEIKHITVLKI